MTIEFGALPERVQRRILLKASGCWAWTGTKTVAGYGVILVNGKRTYVHRLVYELLVSPIPDDLEIHHVCGVRRCCNPAHMEVVTHAEHNRKNPHPIGVDHHFGGLTHCKRGHEFTPENTWTDKRGSRCCMACRRANKIRWRAVNRDRENEQQRCRGAKHGVRP